MKTAALLRLTAMVGMVLVIGACNDCRKEAATIFEAGTADSVVCHWKKGERSVICDRYASGQPARKDTSGLYE
jgi:hypothetical protein